jgi:hypothetical protein
VPAPASTAVVAAASSKPLASARRPLTMPTPSMMQLLMSMMLVMLLSMVQLTMLSATIPTLPQERTTLAAWLQSFC